MITALQVVRVRVRAAAVILAISAAIHLRLVILRGVDALVTGSFGVRYLLLLGAVLGVEIGGKTLLRRIVLK